MKTTKKQFINLIKEVTDEVISEIKPLKDLAPYKQMLTRVKHLVDQSPYKDDLKLIVKRNKVSKDWPKAEPYLELRAYHNRLRTGLGEPLDDELHRISNILIDKFHLEGIERDQSEAGGKAFTYITFKLPEQLDMPGLDEALSVVVPRRPQESVSEAPQKNLSGSSPDKWQGISGGAKGPVSNDVKQFSKELLEKIKDRQRKKGFNDMHLGDAILQMIEFKMTKEGWKRTQNPGPGNSSTISDEEMAAMTDDPFGKKYIKESINEQPIYKDRQGGQDVYWMDNRDSGGKIHIKPEAVAKMTKRGHRVIDINEPDDPRSNLRQPNPNLEDFADLPESSTSLDNYQKESADGDNISLLTWAEERLARESNPNNIDVLEKVIKLIKHGDVALQKPPSPSDIKRWNQEKDDESPTSKKIRGDVMGHMALYKDLNSKELSKMAKKLKPKM